MSDSDTASVEDPSLQAQTHELLSTAESTPHNHDTHAEQSAVAGLGNDYIGLIAASLDFSAWVTDQTFPFLNAIDVEDVHSRRAAFHGVSEETIAHLLQLAEAVLFAAEDYAQVVGNAQMLEAVGIYRDKKAALKRWLCL